MTDNVNDVLTTDNLNGVFTPDKQTGAVILNPSDIVDSDKQTIYEWFLSGVLDNRRKKYRELLLSSIGKNQEIIIAADVLTSVLNSVCNIDELSGLRVPSYRGYAAVCSFYIEEITDDVKPYLLTDKPDRYEVILPDDKPDVFIKMVFSKKIILKDGLLNRIDNFTGDGSLRFAAAVLDVTNPRGLIDDVRNEERAKQNIITREIRDMIMSYTPDSLTIRAVEQTLISGWFNMDELVKDVLLSQYVEDVHKYLKKRMLYTTLYPNAAPTLKPLLRLRLKRRLRFARRLTTSPPLKMNNKTNTFLFCLTYLYR